MSAMEPTTTSQPPGGLRILGLLLSAPLILAHNL